MSESKEEQQGGREQGARVRRGKEKWTSKGEARALQGL